MASIQTCLQDFEISEPSFPEKKYLEELVHLPWSALYETYCETERTLSIKELLDYVMCAVKIKRQPTKQSYLESVNRF